ncbi:hypothetical protein HanHA89_Chr15g0597511 [Helianthus annuus]|nr:hypothetical protein HanHA89_Chr15g0597511 [Helianthus annuus]
MFVFVNYTKTFKIITRVLHVGGGITSDGILPLPNFKNIYSQQTTRGHASSMQFVEVVNMQQVSQTYLLSQT